MPDTELTPRPGLIAVLYRVLKLRCPCCGRGKLYDAYLKQVERCAVCHEPLGHIRTDDAAPWLTIFVTGHILVPMILSLDPVLGWPEWASLVLWAASALFLMLLILPRAKAVCLGVIWALRLKT